MARRRFLPRLEGASRWLVAGGGIAAIVAIVGLVFDLFPGIKPKAATECSALGAELSDVQATGRFTRRAYLERENGSTANLTSARLGERGVLITFDFGTQGYLHQSLKVGTRVVTADRAPVSGPELDIPLALTVVPQSCTDSGHREVWSALPDAAGRYRVELRLLDPSGQELRSKETGVIVVSRRRA